MKGMIQMKKSIKYILLFAVMLFGLLSCEFLANKTIHVPKAVIQEKTDKKFPITKNFLVASVTLKNPKVDFKDEKLLIETDYNINLLDENSKGKMYLSSGIRIIFLFFFNFLCWKPSSIIIVSTPHFSFKKVAPS